MNKYNRHIIIPIFTLFLVVFLTACGNRQHVDKGKKLPNKSTKELENALFAQDSIPFHFFAVRIGVDLKSTQRTASFSCYVKLNVDTAFGGSIKLGPIVGAAYMITTDSIFFANKTEKCYFAESLDFVSTLFGTEIEFDFFQDLILGLPIGLEEGTNYQQIKVDDHYILSSHKERLYKRLENDRLNLEDDVMLIQYHMDTADLNVFQTNIEVPSDTTSIQTDYLESKMEEGFRVPEATAIYITNPKDTIEIQLNYGSVKINNPSKIKIKIPDSYIECK
ncbi:MAG: DUF4292 domain-containing protein [Flavobacteriaceae bacterium]|nr:DUF4292 domain-containing protein [Flavobacteriaceae bacterium]